MKRYILDTREPHEFTESHVDGAVNIPPHTLMGDALPAPLNEAEFDDELIVYCRSGMRSNTVSQILKMHGFTNLINGVNEHHVNKLLQSER